MDEKLQLPLAQHAEPHDAQSRWLYSVLQYFDRRCDRLEKALVQLREATAQETTLLENMKEFVMNALDTLTAQVKANTDAESSAVVLLGGLKKALDDAIAAGNPAALTALSTALGTSQADLAAAILANTPAETPAMRAKRKP